MSDIAQRLAPIISGQTTGLDAAREIQALRGPELDKFIQRGNFTPEQLARLSPRGIGANSLTGAQNIKALRHNAAQLAEGGLHKVPGRVMSAAWRNSLGTGGNASMGAGLRGRYLPMGARLAMATQLAPGALEATKDIDPTGRGRSKTERFGSVAGGALGNLLGAVPSSVTNRLGMGGGMAAGVLAGMGGQLIGQSLGAAAGRVVDRGVSAVRGVQAGDGTQPQTTVQRQTGSNAV